MSNANDNQEQKLTAGKPEAFPLPRTMPANWDLSTLDDSEQTRRAFPRPAAQGQGQQSSTTVDNGRARSRPQPEQSSESFPQPRTFPGNWELAD